MARCSLFVFIVMVAVGVPAHPSHAEDAILLAEVVPALSGTELGMLPVAPAPPAGSARVVYRTDVLAALRASGRSPEGLRIPRSIRIRREARTLDANALRTLVETPLTRALAPCDIDTFEVAAPVTVAQGEITASVEIRRPVGNETNVAGTAILRTRGADRRVPIRAQIRCPEPAVSPGQHVHIVIVVGSVRASAPGEARQAGRVGDTIRVRNRATQAALVAVVRDAETVEVVR
jgi:hypothetical protein